MMIMMMMVVVVVMMRMILMTIKFKVDEKNNVYEDAAEFNTFKYCFNLQYK